MQGAHLAYPAAPPEGEASVEGDGDVELGDDGGHDSAKADVCQANQDLDRLLRKSCVEAFISELGPHFSLEVSFPFNKYFVVLI